MKPEDLFAEQEASFLLPCIAEVCTKNTMGHKSYKLDSFSPVPFVTESKTCFRAQSINNKLARLTAE